MGRRNQSQFNKRVCGRYLREGFFANMVHRSGSPARTYSSTTTVAPRANQDAPRRLYDWGPGPDYNLLQLDSWKDANTNGTNDFAEWAKGTQDWASFGFVIP